MSGTVADVLRRELEVWRDVIRAWSEVQAVINRLKADTRDVVELIAFAECFDHTERQIDRAQREIKRLSASRLLKEYGEPRWMR